MIGSCTIVPILVPADLAGVAGIVEEEGRVGVHVVLFHLAISRFARAVIAIEAIGCCDGKVVGFEPLPGRDAA